MLFSIPLIIRRAPKSLIESHIPRMVEKHTRVSNSLGIDILQPERAGASNWENYILGLCNHKFVCKSILATLLLRISDWAGS